MRFFPLIVLHFCMVLNIKDQQFRWKLLDSNNAVQKCMYCELSCSSYFFVQQGKTLNFTFFQRNEFGPSASFTTDLGSIWVTPWTPPQALHSPDGRQMPAVKVVQGDCGRVCPTPASLQDGPFHSRGCRLGYSWTQPLHSGAMACVLGGLCYC